MENELYHYGRKGMKWYQNIFSKNKKGKGRVGDDDEVSTEPKPKTAYQKARTSVNDMTDDDLKAAIQRLQNERTYRQLYNELNPQQVSKSKEFLSNVFDKAVTPALMEAGKQVLRDYAVNTASKALGLKKEEVADTYGALKKEVETLELKKRKTQVEDFYENREKKAAKDRAKEQQDAAKKLVDSNSKELREAMNRLDKKHADEKAARDAEVKQKAETQAKVKEIMAKNEREWKAMSDRIDKKYNSSSSAQNTTIYTENQAAGELFVTGMIDMFK